MPHANIWVRKEDWDTWLAIPNKSEWVHDHLGVSELRSERKDPVPRVFQEPPTGGQLIESVPVSPERTLNGLCKIHGTPLTHYGKCLQIGCKYS